ncbi:MAG: DUF5647 family protein [Anaerolineae bacterium]
MRDDKMFELNVDLQAAFMRYVIARPDVLDRLPDDFQLVILSDDDPALSWRNLELLKEQGDTDKPIVIVRMRTQEFVDLTSQPLQIFTPIAA